MTARRFVLATTTFALMTTAVPAAQPDPYLDVIRNLRHPNPETRLEALAQLNRAAYADAAEAVAPLVTDPDDRVQAAAIDAELSFFLIDRGRAAARAGRRTRSMPDRCCAGPRRRRPCSWIG